MHKKQRKTRGLGINYTKDYEKHLRMARKKYGDTKICGREGIGNENSHRICV